jgi:hypothetical protein
MGILHVNRGRLAPALILVALVVLAVVAGLGIIAGPANAQASFTPTCAGCHGMTATHGNANHSSLACTSCHVDGNTGTPPTTAACGKCHGGVTSIIKTTQHVANGCGTTVGCHGYTPPVVATTTLTAKVAPTTVTHGKTVKVTGTAGPAAALKGAKVAFKVERKVGTKWIKMKTGTATAGATGAFTWSYKTAKAGAHRVTMSIAKTATHTAKSMVKSFKVK